MLDQEDLKWIAAASTDLNSIVLQVSRYADLLRRHKGDQNCLDLLTDRVELASEKSQALFDRVTTKILEGAAVRRNPVKLTVVAPPVPPKLPAEIEQAEARKSVLVTSAASAVPEFAPDVRVKNPKGDREYILIVEDEPEVAELASKLLAEEGYKVIIARDGFEALKIYQNAARKIALVILDFFLPVMDGDVVFDELCSVNPNVNVVLSSGFAEQSKIGAMLARGLRGFMPKPYTREKLLEQVRSALDAGRQTGS
jgi:CheY-like chemotaxis protein